MVTFREILKEKEFWLLCFLGVLMFPGTVLFGETFFFRDLYLHYLPQKELLRQMLRNGELPLWNPYYHGGQPFLAEINFSVLYPSNLLYLTLPLFTAFNIDIVGHVIAGAAGAYCLARFTGLSTSSSFLCGLVFGFCGFSLSLINLMNRLLAYPYIPWLCVLWHRTLLTKWRQGFLLCVLLSVFQLLAGSPEWSLITFAFMLLWSLAYPYDMPVSRRIGLLALAGISAAFISAIQLIPTFEMTRVSSRAQSTSFEVFSLWSLHFERLPEIIFPNFLGRTDTLAASDFWGARIEDLGFPYLLSIYFGLGILFLAATGTGGANGSIQTKRLRYLFATVAVLALFFSFGRYFPLNRFIYEWIPGLDRFRYPMKFLCIAILPISYLAAAGFEFQWNNDSWKPSRARLIFLWLFTAGLALLGSLILFNQTFLENFSSAIFKLPASNIIRSGIFRSIVHAFVMIALLSLIYTLRKFRPASFQKICVLTVLALDLIIAGKDLNPLAPASFYEETPDAVNLVRKELSGGRLYRTPNPTGIVLNAPSNDVLWQYRWNQEVLFDYLAASYEIPVIYHADIDGLAQKRIMDLTNSLGSLPWEKRVPLLSAAGVTVIITHEKLKLAGIKPLYVLRNRSNVMFYIYKNTNSVLPASLIYKLHPAKDILQTLEVLSSPNFNPGSEAATDEKFNPSPLCPNNSGKVKLLRQQLRTIEFEVTAACNGYLVSGIPYYKGWKVLVDGSAQELIKMNWAFSGVQIPAGSHKVLFHYSPDSVKVGAAISVVSILLLVIFAVKMKHAFKKA